MADEIEEKVEQENDSGKKKKGKGFDATVSDGGVNAMYTDAESDEGSSVTIVLIVFFIVLIWIAILGLLIKLDIGGFGSNVLYPVLKDVPVLSMVLPDGVEDERAAMESDYDTLAQAVSEINRLKAENEALKQNAEAVPQISQATEEEVNAYKEEIKRLKTFEKSQVDFQKLKTEFYEEVVFSDKAPDAETYKKYYESIDPENAEYLYRQVIQQLEADKELSEYVKAYSDMKPKQAAAIFEMMTDNLDLVAKILKEMDPSARGKILGVMDSEIASRITKIMNPD